MTKCRSFSINKPQAHTTAPSSSACFTVLYPWGILSWGLSPGLRTMNFSSKFRLRKGSKLMIGRMMSETNEFAMEVKAAARLQCVSIGTHISNSANGDVDLTLSQQQLREHCHEGQSSRNFRTSVWHGPSNWPPSCLPVVAF